MSTRVVASTNPGAPQRGTDAGRAVALVVGSLLVLLGVAVLVAGGTAAWFGNHRDSHGYMMSGGATASTRTAALVSQRMTLNGVHGARSDWLGNVRISVGSTDGAPVFVGIARESDAAAYLAGTAYDRVTMQGRDPYGHHPWARSQRVDGDLRPLPSPAGQRFWVASAGGAGRQTVTWSPADGEWVLVVTNEDGSPGVQVTADVGMNAPVLDRASPVLLGVGVVVLGGGILLIVVGARTRRNSRSRVG